MTRSRQSTSCAPRRASTGGASSSPATVAGRKTHLLRATPGVDGRRVFLAGHSLGAILAPRIGVRDGSLAGVVLLAAPSRPMSEVVRDQARSLLEPGATEAQRLAAPGVSKEASALADVYAGRPGPPSGLILD